MDTVGRGWASDNRPYFFLSYAHTPAWGPGGGDPDHWVHVLFTDLCGHIMHLTDLPAGAQAGFMDREMRSGDGWPEKLSENLAACRVFVPLYSPRYFTSEMCGREWFAFNERIVRARATGSDNTSAIVPVLWTGVDYNDFPDSVRHFHIEHFGARYAEQGIYGLIKLNRLRDEYQEAVLRLAQLIVQVARDSPLPSARPRPYETTPSAFRPRGTGTRHIHLTVAAPTRDTLPDGRSEQPYGEDALDWNPYHSEATRPLTALAEELIRSLDYRITVSSFDDEDAGAGLGAAPDPAAAADPGSGSSADSGSGSGPAARVDGDGNPAGHRPGILLVDRWALMDSDRQRRLKEFDAASQPWVSAVVPWNRADMQCHSDEGRRLTEEFERTLPNLLDRSRRTECRIAVTGVPTLKAFTDVLPSVVASTTQRYLKHAAAHPPAGPHPPRPRLVGPLPPQDRATGDEPGGGENDDGDDGNDDGSNGNE